MAPPNFSPPVFCEKSPCAYGASRMCNCLPWLEGHRKQVFMVFFALQFFAIIPASIAIVGVARGKQLTIGSWASEDVDGKNGYADFHLFIGMHGIYTRGGVFGREFLTWNEVKDVVPSNKRDNVNSCKSAAKSEVSTAIIGFITILPSLATLWTRSFKQFDTGCNKFIGIASCLIGALTTLSSLSTFVNKCYKDLPTKFVFDGVTIGEGDKKIGPGLACEILLANITLLIGVVHLLVPVPKPDDPLVQEDTRNPL